MDAYLFKIHWPPDIRNHSHPLKLKSANTWDLLKIKVTPTYFDSLNTNYTIICNNKHSVNRLSGKTKANIYNRPFLRFREVQAIMVTVIKSIERTVYGCQLYSSYPSSNQLVYLWQAGSDTVRLWTYVICIYL